MTARVERKLGMSLAAAGVGIVGAATVFGLTTESGGPDWINIVMALGGAIMIATGLFRVFRGRTPGATR